MHEFETFALHSFCGLPPQAHSAHILTPSFQHPLPVSFFDIVARELSPRMEYHRFASWKGDVPFIIQMQIALREAKESATPHLFTCTSMEALQFCSC